MAGLRRIDRYLNSLLIDSFDWSAIKGTVVDCRGSNSYISKSLAEVRPPYIYDPYIPLAYLVENSGTLVSLLLYKTPTSIYLLRAESPFRTAFMAV